MNNIDDGDDGSPFHFQQLLTRTCSWQYRYFKYFIILFPFYIYKL